MRVAPIRLTLFVFVPALAFLLAGCTRAGDSAQAVGLTTTSPTLRVEATTADYRQPTRTAVKEGEPNQATLTAIPSPAPGSGSLPLSPTLLATVTALPPSPTPCTSGTCIQSGSFVFQRPIFPPGRNTIDTTYRFGTTANGERDVHHGVELLNSTGTPVHAAADGIVIVAGDDRKVFQGPYSYFYGNLVVLEHHFSGFTAPVYSLYAHLSAIDVELGQRVQVGQEIGKVGMTGIATGSHLHFEVRYGENSYAASRNPELWLQPLDDESGKPMGALAGAILDEHGQILDVENLVVEHLTSQEGHSDWEIYLRTYEEQGLRGEPPWEESFALGDLPAGWYRLSFVQYGMQSLLFQVLPGQLTRVVLPLSPNF